MTLRTIDFETGANGAAMTAVNSGGMNPPTVSGGSAFFTNSPVREGTLSAVWTNTTTNTAFTIWKPGSVAGVTVNNAAAVTNLKWNFGFVMLPMTGGLDASGDMTNLAIYNSTSAIMRVIRSATEIRVQGASGSGNTVIATGLSASGVYRVSGHFEIGTTTANGIWDVRVYQDPAVGNTQLGAATSAVANLGTTACGDFRYGANAVSAVTPVSVNLDYLQTDDGAAAFSTTIGLPPAAGATVANAGPSQYPQAGATITLTSAASTGSGTLTTAWTTVSVPAGVATPSYVTTGTTTTVMLANQGRYVFSASVTGTGGTNAATVTHYVHGATADDVLVYSATGPFTNEGGAATPELAVNDADTGTALQSPVNPVATVETYVMNPFGLGAMSVFIQGNYIGALVNRTITWYREDGTTVLQAIGPFALTTALVDTELALGSTALATLTGANDAATYALRRATVVKTSDTAA